MKIAVASLGDPRSVKTWSGTPSHIIAALEKRGHEVAGISVRKPVEPWHFDWQRRIHMRLQKKWFLSSVDKIVLEDIGKQIDQEVEKINPDIVLVIHGDFLAYCTFKQPAIIVHDTTFASLVGYYPEFSNLSQRSIRAGNDMYQRALNKASAAVFSAGWASQSATKDYRVDPNKIFTIPFGANLREVPADTDVENWITKRSQATTCSFLFLGVRWERKGGPDALRFVKALHQMGISSQLVVVGCSPEVDKEDEVYVQQLGFLRKDVPQEKQQLESLFQTCQALLVPSVAECYGCVFCEANAYGLPVLARETGGIPEIVKDGLNGLLLGPHETPEELARRWAKIYTDKDGYQQMSHKARAEYKTRLNYQVFVERLEAIALPLVEAPVEI
ncbi:MAG TPA: glycosyltransferase family 4 protein [Flavisolibacter sp.]|jgi:glycosyltransferase involved in cell wall biosynthesis|nr:glycosyltransferase family 4 protein [Flavisolibacter sp.]